jgi:hypothetical protein
MDRTSGFIQYHQRERLITAYFPSDDKWENDYRKRKVVK